MREAAELMISISDNTAADLLINLLGRERVEQNQATYGHTDPGLNIPFLTTREFAVLKVGPADVRASYLAADESGRREILADIADVRADSLPVGEFVNPVDPDRLEWFASLNDLCALHVRLQEKALLPGLEPVAAILSLNPGIPSEAWEYIAFKGGSEPGLVTASWLVRDSANRTYVMAATVVDP